MSGEYIGTQLIITTGGGTYTPTAGTASVIIELVGGGAGGAGVASPSAAQITVGGGGGGGGYVRKRLTANFSGATYSVGAKGAGGAAGNNNGAAGSDTTFTDTAATVYTAGAGAAGINRTTNAPPQDGRIALGGTATNGDLNIPGGASLGSLVSSVTVGWSSAGGASFYSSGAPAVLSAGTGTSTAGVNADGYGGGGSGAISTNAGGAKAGGDGSNGILLIHEYN